MPAAHRLKRGLEHKLSGVNPRTGKPFTLADEEVQAASRRDLEQMRRRPELAAEFLKDLGVLTPSGKLSRKYGG